MMNLRQFTFFALGLAILVTGCSEEDSAAPPVMTVMDDLDELDRIAEEQRTEALRRKAREEAAKKAAADANVPQEGVFTVKFETSVGTFVVEVDRSWAPIGADRFYKLVQDGFYDEARFFRVVPGFMVQWGLAADPAMTGKWKASIRDDPRVKSNKRGYITFAKTGAPNSRTGQVFINFKDNSFLDPQGFAPFGKVTSGMEVVDKINAEHGESPQQHMIESMGNTYLDTNFPGLSFITKARIVVDDLMTDAEASSTDAQEGEEPAAASSSEE